MLEVGGSKPSPPTKDLTEWLPVPVGAFPAQSVAPGPFV